MKKYVTYIILLVIGLSGLMTGCAENELSDFGFDDGVNLVVSIPAAGLESKTSLSTITTTSVTEDEAKITSLWFFAFPVDGNGERFSKRLEPQDDNVQVNGINYQYEFKMAEGKYHIYVIANYPDITGSETENKLKDCKILYKNGENIQLPDPTNEYGLPMVYEELGTNGAGVEITSPEESTVELEADLVFTCVKVTYAITFDTNDEVFNNNGMKINSVTACNLSDQTYLVENKNKILDKTASLSQTGNFEFKGENEETVENGGTSWVMTGTFYLPEHYVEKTEQTYLQIEGELIDAKTKQPTGDKVSYRIDLDKKQTGTSDFFRGMHWLIKGNVKTTGNVINPTITVSPWTLEQVNIALSGPYFLQVDRTEIETLTAGDFAEIHYDTDVSKLSFESPVLDGKQIYVVTDNESTKTISIGVNPEISYGTVIPDDKKYIYVIAGELKKKITIEEVVNEAYLKVTPAIQRVYIREIINSGNTYTVDFIYTTNLESVDITNNNTNTHLTIDNGKLENHQGTVTCTLNYPYTENYPSSFMVDFKYTATGGTTIPPVTSQLQVIAYSTSTYKLHFRPATDDWENPHIYVYDPLLTPDGKYVRFDTSDGKENAIKYGFTGKVTFLGWKSQAGDVPDVGTDYDAITKINFDPGESTSSYAYNFSIDYCPEYRKECCEGETNLNKKWPGVKMKEDEENPGWYVFDMPALATPGNTLIMFADGHSAQTTTDKRYPDHMVPGMPLYNFDDKDGWFYYNENNKNQEFTDDKPDLPDLSKGTFRIWIKNSEYKEKTYAYVWDDNKKEPLGGFPGNTIASENSIKYIEINGSSYDFTTKVNIILSNGNDASKTGDLSVSVSSFKKVEGNTYIYEADL